MSPRFRLCDEVMFLSYFFFSDEFYLKTFRILTFQAPLISISGIFERENAWT